MNEMYNFKNKSSGSVAWWCFWPSLIFLGLSMVVSIIGVIGIVVYLALTSGIDSPEQLITGVMRFLMPLNIVAQVIGTAIFLPIYLHVRKTAFPKVTKKCHWSVYIWSILFLLGVSTISAFVVEFIGNLWAPVDGGLEAVTDAIFSGSLIATVVSTVIMAPVMEELMIRGLTFNRLLSGTKKWTAIIVSSIIFGVIHMNLLQGLNAIVLGIVLALVFIKTRSIIACMLCHAANNLLSVIGGVLVIKDVANLDTINLWINIACIVLGIIGAFFFFKAKDAELAPAEVKEQ